MFLVEMLVFLFFTDLTYKKHFCLYLYLTFIVYLCQQKQRSIDLRLASISFHIMLMCMYECVCACMRACVRVCVCTVVFLLRLLLIPSEGFRTWALSCKFKTDQADFIVCMSFKSSNAMEEINLNPETLTPKIQCFSST